MDEPEKELAQLRADNKELVDALAALTNAIDHAGHRTTIPKAMRESFALIAKQSKP
jgi:hypothetical protein